jgi:hypothetical protein
MRLFTITCGACCGGLPFHEISETVSQPTSGDLEKIKNVATFFRENKPEEAISLISDLPRPIQDRIIRFFCQSYAKESIWINSANGKNRFMDKYYPDAERKARACDQYVNSHQSADH